MINAMATDKLTIPYVMPLTVKCNQYKLPIANCIQLKADNEIAIQRSIIQLVTTPELRAVHIFHFKEEHTDWRFFEPYHAPLSKNELRGMMIYGIKQFREQKFSYAMTKIRSHSFIHSVEPINEYLRSFEKEDKIYIIMTFKDWSYAIGNYFDETTICRSILQYQPRKIESVIRNIDKDKPILIPKAGNSNYTKEVRIPIFN